MIKIIKRDGRNQFFSADKIINSVKYAADDVNLKLENKDYGLIIKKCKEIINYDKLAEGNTENKLDIEFKFSSTGMYSPWHLDIAHKHNVPLMVTNDSSCPYLLFKNNIVLF